MKRDRRAQEKLYKLCYGFLIGVCRRYYRNYEDAEAVLNQAFLKILTQLEKYNEGVPFNLWIRRVTINTIFDEYRKNKKYNESHVEELVDPSMGAEKKVSYNEADLEFDAQELLNMLDTLPEISRRVFCLFAIDGYSHMEISKMMDIKNGTSKWHVNHARTKLKELILKKAALMSIS